MKWISSCALIWTVGFAIANESLSAAQKRAAGPVTAWILTKDGQNVEGISLVENLKVNIDSKVRDLALRDVLSIHSAEPANDREQERVTAGLLAVAGTDRKARDAAVAELTGLGLPVMTALLAAYKDTDLHEPNPLYRLFARIMPGYADDVDRTPDLIRLANGETLRGKLQPGTLKLKTSAGPETAVAWSELRRLAIRQPEILRTFDVHSLRHCTQIEYLDSGVAVTPTSKLEATARGFVRLAFDMDGWSSDADGLKKPGPNYKTNLVDGFPFGALVAKIGTTGPAWLAGRHVTKSELGAGRLYFAVNDNGHWQNNIGSFRVTIRVTDAYDLGDPQ